MVLLTDGQNDDGDTSTTATSSPASSPRCAAARASSKPIRIFPIAYGKAADLDTLTDRRGHQHGSLNTSNPATITKVFTAVVSNF